ncbi:MAG TPA: hypothetical protein GXZ89_05990 [Fastidiosipila sp.]|nr:hypothetical protein [Fastidiosipila sp.]
MEEKAGKARESRQATIDELLQSFDLAVTLTANVPGWPKEYLTANAVLLPFIYKLLERFPELSLLTAYDELGAFLAFGLNGDKEEVKSFGLTLEDSPLGRLVDIDVYYLDEEKPAVLSRTDLGRGARSCFLCDDEAVICRRLERHAAPDLRTAFDSIYEAYLKELPFFERLATLAEAALWNELCRHYGFGTVTLNSKGSHRDMDVPLLLASIRVIGDGIRSLNETDVSSFDRLRQKGQAMEAAMFNATDGVNTHKGAIFHLLIATSAIYRRPELLHAETGLKTYIFALHEEIKEIAAPLLGELLAIDELADDEKVKLKGGLKSYVKYGHGGARQEAIRGYETLLKKWLPRFSAVPEIEPLLPEILERTWDTTTLERGGFGMLQTLRMMALRAGSKEDLAYLSAWCEEHDLTTGGSADLIGLLYYFYLIYTFRAALA